MQPDLKIRDIRELAACSAFWMLITVIIFWPIVSGEKSVFFGDLALYFIPQFANIASAMHEGKLLFWNHTILGGVPHVGNPQGWLLYPTVWLNAFLPAWHVAGIIPIMHIPAAAVGMHFLARRIGISLVGAMAAAGTFAFSSALLTKAQFPNMVQAIAWTPWVLVAVIGCIQKPGRGMASFLVVLGSLSIASGHAQITWMDALLCIGLVVWKCRSLRALGFLAVAAIGMVLLSAAYIFPMLEIASWSGRDHMSLSEANRFRVPLRGLLGYAMGAFPGGNPGSVTGFRWSGNSWEVAGYFGVVAPAIVWLLALPLVNFKHRLRTQVLVSLLLCLVGWWLSLGVQGGLYPLVYRFVPGAKAFHDPARFLHYVHIAVPLVIGAVLTSLDTIKLGRPLGIVLGLANVASLIALAPVWYPVVPSRVWTDAAAYYKPLRESVVYTQNDRSVWLQYANPKSFAGVQTDKNVLNFLASGIPNIPGTWGVVSQGGYEPVAPKSTMSMQGWTGIESVDDIDRLRGYGVTHIISPSGLVTPVALRRKTSLDSVTRIVNGWQVYAKDNVPMTLLRNQGWEAGKGQQLKVNETVNPSGLVLSGVGQIKYQPASFRLGLFVTLVTLGILAGITLHTVQNARKV
jgi:hypothetical protein